MVYKGRKGLIALTDAYIRPRSIVKLRSGMLNGNLSWYLLKLSSLSDTQKQE